MPRVYVPRKLKPRRRNRISTWASDEEKWTVDAAAALVGETTASFVREAALAAARTVIEQGDVNVSNEVPTPS